MTLPAARARYSSRWPPRRDKQITLEGQEKDVTTAGLARMNMILHDFPTANIVSGNTLDRTQIQGGRAAPHLRLRRRQPTVLRQGLDDWSHTVNGPVPTLCVGRAAGEAGRLRVPAAHNSLDEGGGEGRLRSAARRAVSGQCGSHNSRATCPLRLSQGDYRAASEPLLWHRHLGMHRRARQRERRWTHRRVHDRRLQGVQKGRAEEPATRAGHPQHR